MTQDTVSGSVAVRMYRGILGDCFLLRYEEEGNPGKKHILIDCGVLQGVKGARALMKAIVDDLLTTTQGVLDLLVVTHEHHDHLSGFMYEQDSFKSKFTVNEFWLAWTEDPGDPVAVALRAKFDKTKAGLAALASHTKVVALKDSDTHLRTVVELSAFLGVDADGRPTGASTLKMLKEKATPARTRYLEPGNVVAPVAVGRLNTYVLGPPRENDRLRKDLPSAGAAKEVYLSNHQDAQVLKLKLDQLNDLPIESADLPFAGPHHRPLDAIALGQPKAMTNTQRLYYDTKKTSRKIDDEWRTSAESMALKMDSDTNNTSLVLAFELPDKQVLLFPGDAQVGNWLSWGDQPYPWPSVPGRTGLTIDDILARVTLYKVGHHCSHNATLRQLGLEKMTDPRLVAMIPLVRAAAEQNGWNMPYPELYAALKARTRQHVVIGDSVIAEEQATFNREPTDTRNPAMLSYGPDGLWVEVRISF